MKKFEKLTGVVCPLDRSNVDTDFGIAENQLTAKRAKNAKVAKPLKT